MTDNLISILRCPVCGRGMAVTDDGKSLLCCGTERQHCFDFARSGYVSLASVQGGGDNRDMVRARTQFLSQGYYRPILDGVTAALQGVLPAGGTVIDAGCGEGYYSCGIAGAGYDVFGTDLSRTAVDRAAKTARAAGTEQTLFAVSGLYNLPVADASADAVVSIFAPVAETEFDRVLKPGGYLIIVGAGPSHLMGLKQALYEKTYENGPRADLPKKLVPLGRSGVQRSITVEGNDNIKALFAMTPYCWRTGDSDRRKLDGLDELQTPIDVEILTYGKDKA